MLADLLGPDLIIVIVVAVVVLFGGSQIPKIARSLGSAQTEFKKGLAEGNKDAEAKAAEAKASDADQKTSGTESADTKKE
jgi:sec-independent protein translocase protein TatA